MTHSARLRRTVPAAALAFAVAIALLAALVTQAHASSTQVLRLSVKGNMLMFNTTKLHAHPGKVEILLHNTSSSISHGIAISGNGVKVSSKDAAPGKSVSVTATLKKGTYTFYCPVPGHEQAGMKGTLTVS